MYRVFVSFYGRMAAHRRHRSQFAPPFVGDGRLGWLHPGAITMQRRIFAYMVPTLAPVLLRCLFGSQVAGLPSNAAFNLLGTRRAAFQSICP